jgi:hypothetical protein
MPYTLDIRPSGHRDFEFGNFRCHRPGEYAIQGIEILKFEIFDAPAIFEAVGIEIIEFIP